MKFLLKLLFIPYLALLFLAACGDSEKEVANGYTEEQNASLDSAAYAMLQTWEPKVALIRNKRTLHTYLYYFPNSKI